MPEPTPAPVTPSDLAALLPLLADADRRLVRAVDGLDEAAWAAPSLLPGWTRAHVVAHLALNGEALAAVVDGLRAGTPGPMYASQEARDGDIAALADEPPAALRERLMAATTLAGEAVTALVAGAGRLADVVVERRPGGPTFPVGDVPGMRLREVEIHHADLDVGYAAADWPVPAAVHVLDARSAAHPGPALLARATDVDRRWSFGTPAPGEPSPPTVSGPVRALAWWSTGRGDGDGLTSDGGRVPRLGAW